MVVQIMNDFKKKSKVHIFLFFKIAIKQSQQKSSNSLFCVKNKFPQSHRNPYISSSAMEGQTPMHVKMFKCKLF